MKRIISRPRMGWLSGDEVRDDAQRDLCVNHLSSPERRAVPKMVKAFEQREGESGHRAQHQEMLFLICGNRKRA